MKKLLIILIAFLPLISFAQTELGEHGNMDTMKISGASLIYAAPTEGENYYTKMRDPSDSLDGVNLRTLFRRIQELDSLGILVTNIISGNETVNTGTTNIHFETPFDSTDVTVVTYVRRISDKAVIDYRIDDVDQNGFNVTVWEDNINVFYVASQKNPESNNFFETILHESDTATIVIDTTQVRNLAEFVENHSTGGTITNSIKITYTGIPQTPLILPLSTNSMAVASIDSASGQQTYTAINGAVLNYFSYTENSATVGNRLLTLSFDDLMAVENAFAITGLTGITGLYAPRLKYIGGAFSPSNMVNLVSCNFDSLLYCASFSPINIAIDTLTCPSLQNVPGVFSPSNMGNVIFVDFPELINIGGGMSIGSMSSLVKISFAKMINYYSTIGLNSGLGNLKYIKLGEIGTLKLIGGNAIAINNQKLSQGSVDSTLTLLASLDGTNGTTLFGTGKTVLMNGGTSAAPTFTGSSVTQAGSSFVGVTTTCTVSWVGHGYTTGDLLTISGITTLTTANGTFQIVVDSPDQFHYTKATGTGTGAGTATIIKAGSTTEGYYYKQLLQSRGATVTTN